MYHLILNPHALRGRMMRHLPEIEAAMQAAQLPYTLHHSPRVESLDTILSVIPLDEYVVAVGGDGTVRVLASRLQVSGHVLGIIPLGSGNDFIGSLGWSIHIPEAVERLKHARVKLYDMGVWQSQVFVNGLGMGFDAEVGIESYHAPKMLVGMPRYLWAIMAALRKLQTQQVSIVVDGIEVYSGKAFLVSVMNSTRYGGGFQVSPESDPSDGKLNVVVGKDLSKWQILKILPTVASGKHSQHPQVFFASGKHIKVHWAGVSTAQMDGDILPSGQLFEIGIHHHSLKLIS